VPLNTNGMVSVTNAFQTGTPVISAYYVSDTVFASSSGGLHGTAPALNVMMNSNGAVQLQFTNVIGAPFSVFGSTDLSLALTNWTSLGPALEISPGRFQFTDIDTTNFAQRFYRVGTR
jgi:hypothetical protein